MDKIKHHEKVVNYLVQMQMNSIDKSKPREFLRTTLDSDTINQTISKKLTQIYQDGIPISSQQMAKLITKYKQEGHDQKFKDHWQFYLNLELISEAFNNIIKGEI